MAKLKTGNQKLFIICENVCENIDWLIDWLVLRDGIIKGTWTHLLCK